MIARRRTDVRALNRLARELMRHAGHLNGAEIEIGGHLVDLDSECLHRVTNHGDPVVAHGYAVTGRVAQGLTTDRAFVLASDELHREWTYTAMSRTRRW